MDSAGLLDKPSRPLHRQGMRIAIFTALAVFISPLMLHADGEKFATLAVGGNIYTNVTVTSVSATDIYFTHVGGMENVKIKALSPDLQKLFSYDPAKDKKTELKQTADNAKYHDRMLHQTAVIAADAQARTNQAAAATIYGDVDPKYAASTITKSGDVSPLTYIRTIDGGTLDLRGKVVVIDLFATWCGPCKEEMPYVEKYLWQGFKDKGLIVVAVGREHTKAEVAAFQKQNRYTFYFAEDPQKEIYGKFATEYIPRCILVGKDGRIKCQTAGFSKDDFRKLIVGATFETGK
jgi:thiol-disulfide isomerase/thioredoxin